MSRDLLLREIPSISKFMESNEGEQLISEFGAGVIKFYLRSYFDRLRKEIRKGERANIPTFAKLATEIKDGLKRITSPMGRKAVNATGILLHTALGRAPYADNARDSLSVFNSYSVLQAGLEDGKRCKRDAEVEAMICELTGAEAATVINNNAEGTMLIINALASGKEAVISRGQLVEIGGSFRMPDVMEQSGAKMVEIGTTNRTHLKDYSAVVNDETGVVVHVHTSNYRVRGFAGTPNIKEICELRKKEFPNIPVIDDIGSGALISLSEFGLTDEPLIRDSILAGSDLVCFSGDKLICGPQCGIICGKKEFIEKIRKNPFARMFRVDKMTLAVMESTLVHFLNKTYKEAIPFYKMLSAKIADLEVKAAKIADVLNTVKGISIEILDGSACIGSGSIPDEHIADKILKISFESKSVSLEKITKQLRFNLPSIFARINENAIVFSMRTLLDGDDTILMQSLPALLDGEHR